MQIVSYSAKTDKGPFLSTNEDDYLIDLDRNIYGIFDGVGGGRVGVALVKTLKEHILKFYTKFSKEDATLPLYYSPRFLIEGNALINAVHQSNFLLYEENIVRENKGAASLVLMNIVGSILTVASVGNGLIYLLRNNKLKLLNFADSFSLDNSIPTNLLGIYESIDLNLREVKLHLGDLVILLSDGIYSKLDESEILSLMQSGDLNSSIENIFSSANKKGNQDNQTALFLQF